jgi:hypothetical protein
MTHCIRCHRPLKRPTPSGMGPVCEKASKPAPEYERDLLGYDIDKACEVARERIAIVIESLAVDAQIALRRAFRQARARLGVSR